MTAMREMPQYQCHKKVWALRIKAVEQSPADKVVAGGSWELLIEPEGENEGYEPITVSHAWHEKNKPEAGGYYVVYADGYKSFSPAKSFEDGYTRI